MPIGVGKEPRTSPEARGAGGTPASVFQPFISPGARQAQRLEQMRERADLKEEARARQAKRQREQFDYRLTAKQRADQERYQNALYEIEQMDDFSEEEKETARRRIHAKMLGIKPLPHRKEEEKFSFQENVYQHPDTGSYWYRDPESGRLTQIGKETEEGAPAVSGEQRREIRQWALERSVNPDTGEVDRQRAEKLYNWIMGQKQQGGRTRGGRDDADSSFWFNLPATAKEYLKREFGIGRPDATEPGGGRGDGTERPLAGREIGEEENIAGSAYEKVFGKKQGVKPGQSERFKVTAGPTIKADKFPLKKNYNRPEATQAPEKAPGFIPAKPKSPEEIEALRRGEEYTIDKQGTPTSTVKYKGDKWEVSEGLIHPSKMQRVFEEFEKRNFGKDSGPYQAMKNAYDAYMEAESPTDKRRYRQRLQKLVNNYLRNID